MALATGNNVSLSELSHPSLGPSFGRKTGSKLEIIRFSYGNSEHWVYFLGVA